MLIAIIGIGTEILGFALMIKAIRHVLQEGDYKASIYVEKSTG